EAQVQRGRPADPLDGTVDRTDGVLAGLLGARLEPRLVELHDVGAGSEQVRDLLAHGFRVSERERLAAAVMLVDRLLRHRERPGQRDLDDAVGVRAEEAHVAHLDRLAPADRSGDERHRNLRAGPADDLAVTLAVDPVERVREAVRVALAADLAVGDDVDSGALLVADRDDRRVVLRLLEMLGRYSPDLADA